MKQLLLTGIVLIVTVIGYGQRARAYWEDDTVLIGQHAKLHLFVDDCPEQMKWEKIHSASDIERRQSNENLYRKDGEIEVLSVVKKYDKAKRQFEITCELLVWDTANYQLPVQEFNIYSPDWKVPDTTLSVTVPELTCVFVKKKVDKSVTEIPLVEESNPFGWIKRYWWVFALLLCIFLGMYFWNKRRTTRFIAKETLKNRTLKQLQQLRKQALWESDQVEKHYVAFSKIIKSFLTERYGHHFIGKTSYETELGLKVLKVEDQVIVRIKKLLLESDFSKFGKSVPDKETIVTSLNKLEELIVELSPLDLPTEERV